VQFSPATNGKFSTGVDTPFGGTDAELNDEELLCSSFRHVLSKENRVLAHQDKDPGSTADDPKTTTQIHLPARLGLSSRFHKGRFFRKWDFD
jgi:hypothetical protein